MGNKFRHLIFILIGLSLLTYSSNFFIMYYLYPKTDEIRFSHRMKRMSIENIYDDIPMRNVASEVVETEE